MLSRSVLQASADVRGLIRWIFRHVGDMNELVSMEILNASLLGHEITVDLRHWHKLRWVRYFTNRTCIPVDLPFSSPWDLIFRDAKL